MTLHLADYRISQYGDVKPDDQIGEVFAEIAKADILVVGTPVYWYSVSGIYKTFMDRWYMLPAADALKGKKLYFFAQGSGPSKEAVATIKYLIRRSSMLAEMKLESLVINTGDISEMREQLKENIK